MQHGPSRASLTGNLLLDNQNESCLCSIRHPCGCVTETHDRHQVLEGPERVTVIEDRARLEADKSTWLRLYCRADALKTHQHGLPCDDLRQVLRHT